MGIAWFILSYIWIGFATLYLFRNINEVEGLLDICLWPLVWLVVIFLELPKHIKEIP